MATERMRVRVVPNASRDALAGLADGVLKVKLQAVAEGGRANAALCEFLAMKGGCRRREVQLVSGEKSRQKVVTVPAEAARHLREAVQS